MNKKETYIQQARIFAAGIAAVKGSVTTADLHELFVSPPKGMPSNVFGAVLRSSLFEKVGDMPSTRPEARGRRVGVYTLAPKSVIKQAELLAA